MLKKSSCLVVTKPSVVQTRRSRVKMKFHKLLRDLDLESLQYKQISELSGGLQRVLVARALMSDSTIYLLDEPFVGIDFNSEQLIMEKLQHLKSGQTYSHWANLFLIVHHDLSKVNNILIEFLLNRTVFFGPSHQRCTTKFKPDISI